MLIKITLHSEWPEWRKNFCETYENKGWTLIMYALSFKYKTRPLLDYAMKKEKLFLEARKTIDTGILIDIITSGLPGFIADKIDRENLKATEDLCKEIGKLEHLVNRRKNYEKKTTPIPNKKKN